MRTHDRCGTTAHVWLRLRLPKLCFAPQQRFRPVRYRTIRAGWPWRWPMGAKKIPTRLERLPAADDAL